MRRHDTLRVYRDSERRWRWSYIASNGRILADSGQSYSRRSDAVYGAKRVIDFFAMPVRWVWE